MIFGVQRKFLEFNGKFRGIKMISRVQNGIFWVQSGFLGLKRDFY